MNKIIKAAWGLLLLIVYVRKFDKEKFSNKRIAIIGPAGSTIGTGNGGYIDDFDLIIRINKSVLLIDSNNHENDIGKRTDVLFHSFYENNYSGGGPLNFEVYNRQGIKYVINPDGSFKGLRNSFNFYKKYIAREYTFILPRNIDRDIKVLLQGHKPTTGFSALYYLITSNFSELYIAGFTFFKTAYLPGYRDEMREANKVNQYIKQAGLHDPDREYYVFKQLLIENKNKKILLDDELSNIIKHN